MGEDRAAAASQLSPVPQRQITWTHDDPIKVEEARDLGLPVRTEVPDEIYRLMALYSQARQRRPSVGYIPIPHGRTSPSGGGGRRTGAPPLSAAPEDEHSPVVQIAHRDRREQVYHELAQRRRRVRADGASIATGALRHV